MEDEKHKLKEDEMEVVSRPGRWRLETSPTYVPTPEYQPAAESMRNRGWLISRVLDNGDTAYGFSPKGEETFKVYNAALSRNAANN